MRVHLGSWSSLVLPAVVSLQAACLFSSGDDPTDPGVLGGSLTVSGVVVDLMTDAPVPSNASVSVAGLTPPPMISTTGSGFIVTGVPEHSVFHLLAAAAPTHRATYGRAIELIEADRAEVHAVTVSEASLAAMSTAFAVTPSAGRGVLMTRLVDRAGAGRAGVAASTLQLAGAAVDGPHFLDEAMAPAPTLSATSGSGWVVYFEVDPGVASLTAAAAATHTIDMPVAPIGPATVTVTEATVIDGAVMPPTNVSFAQQVFPIFERRGCDGCHSGGGIGRDLAGLTLDGSANLVYRELVEEQPGRVVVGAPATSQVLTMPSLESPADRHPNVTFTSALDPDYQLLLAWIVEGARDN